VSKVSKPQHRRIKGMGSSVKLHIEAKDKNGKVTQVVDKEGDLYTDQYACLQAALFAYLMSGGGSLDYTCKDTGNVQRSLRSNNDAGSYTTHYADRGACFASANPPNGAGIIRIGVGQTAAAHDDHAVQTPITPTGTISNPQLTVGQGGSGQQAIVTFGTTIAPASTPVDVYEASVEVQLYDNGGTLRSFILTHDIFAVVHVGSGGSITLTFTFTWNS
jgi:hypothetical protein